MLLSLSFVSHFIRVSYYLSQKLATLSFLSQASLASAFPTYVPLGECPSFLYHIKLQAISVLIRRYILWKMIPERAMSNPQIICFLFLIWPWLPGPIAKGGLSQWWNFLITPQFICMENYSIFMEGAKALLPSHHSLLSSGLYALLKIEA